MVHESSLESENVGSERQVRIDKSANEIHEQDNSVFQPNRYYSKKSSTQTTQPLRKSSRKGKPPVRLGVLVTKFCFTLDAASVN